MAMNKDLYTVIRPAADVKSTDPFAFGTNQRWPMTGFYKTVMQWLKCFFTEVGTDTSDRSYGTVFGGYIGGNVGSSADVHDAAALSVTAATQTIRNYQQSSGVPSSERLASVVLTDINVLADSVELYVTMTNEDGLPLNLAIPASTASFNSQR